MSRSRDFVRKIRSIETLDAHRPPDVRPLTRQRSPSSSNPPLDDDIPRVNIRLPKDIIDRIANGEKTPETLKEWLNAIDPNGAMLAGFMYGVMLSEDVAIKERIAMMKEIRDTGHGKPAQPIDQTHTFNPNQLRTAGLSDDDIKTLEGEILPIPAYLTDAQLPPIPVTGTSIDGTIFKDSESGEDLDDVELPPVPEFDMFGADAFEDAG